ncbi:dipeptide ABC transporter ATP-binding protein [Leisingera sp. ANG-Vp]|uniref:dipeptide ABC transporter ATP-binding protein n=1 Tax=Leisingera sp. ANG-Vp TaxID=1577896 RepID=UPI00057C848D|nr:ABC transporter ATP-binding protein [Leisingera sp. ANG-Vp]KIC20368.1 ABC transporter ATP-binding protein [Leisingera sp. ANG-Vp]
MTAAPIIDIQDISIGFTGLSGSTLPVLRNIDLSVRPGESVGLVGESGSGKSTLALAAMGYLKRGLRVLNGSSHFNGDDMFSQSRKSLEHIRGGKLGLVPQNSGQSLTPTLRIGAQLTEALRLHSKLDQAQYRARVLELLGQVRLPDPEAIYARFPHELSGGQQQRVAIAMALAGEPDALLLDEPTTGLDVTTQAHILELLRDLAAETGMAMVYVSHDLGAIARVCDRVVVMYAGEVVLESTAKQVLTAPTHPYARGLLASIPKLSDPHLPTALDGRPPAPGKAGAGCAFVDRCGIASGLCRSSRPPLAAGPGGAMSRCHHAEQANQLPMTSTGADPERSDPNAPAALALDKVSISYAKQGLIEKLLGKEDTRPVTVDGISVAMKRGETLGLVGESGSGKSTILKSIAGLLPPAGGEITFGDGGHLPQEVERRSNDHLRRIQLIFQNPDDSMNPRHTIAEILEQPLKLYFGLKGQALHDRSAELLERVRLGAHYMTRLPSQLSGGEKQRVAVARAFAAEPELVLCDEVTSALDVSVQAAVLDLLNELKQEQGTTYVFVSHDLAVVRALSDRVAVLYQGRLCEIGPSEDVYALPSHPYTEVLLGAVLEPDPDYAPKLTADDVIELAPPAQGCPFQRRCPRKLGAICDTDSPPWQQQPNGHAVRCHISLEELNRLQVDEARSDETPKETLSA